MSQEIQSVAFSINLVSNLQLLISHIDTFKVEATNAVLGRLGKDVYENLKYDLQTKYKIEITKHTSYTLHELHISLEALLGEHSAQLIMRTIKAEIERLAKDEMR